MINIFITPNSTSLHTAQQMRPHVFPLLCFEKLLFYFNTLIRKYDKQNLSGLTVKVQRVLVLVGFCFLCGPEKKTYLPNVNMDLCICFYMVTARIY